MLGTVKSKIIKSKIKTNPYPYIFIKNLLGKKTIKELNSILPKFNELEDDQVLFQSSSKTKKTLMPDSLIYKNLNKKKIFNNFNLLFKKLKPVILNKFKKEIKKYVNKDFINSKLNYHSSYSVSKSGYLKSAHIDRRDHLITIIFYVDSDNNKGGDICINKVKSDGKKTFDIFPNKKKIKIHKQFKVTANSCLIILNLPWAYHSVNKYYGKTDRKYFYCVYDFKILKSGSIKQNRQKGYNENNFWKHSVQINSSKRKKIFLSE
jgi:hypothetical protein